jgi:hypothetical protein
MPNVKVTVQCRPRCTAYPSVIARIMADYIDETDQSPSVSLARPITRSGDAAPKRQRRDREEPCRATDDRRYQMTLSGPFSVSISL